MWKECNCAIVWTFFGIVFFGIEIKTSFSSLVTTTEFSKFAGILSAAVHGVLKARMLKWFAIYISSNILGISELKWTGMDKFNSEDHNIYYCGQESLRINRVALIVNKSLKCSTWVQSQKQQNDLCLCPRQTIQYHSNPSLGLNH